MRFDLSVNLDAQLVKRTVGGKHVRDVAERIFMRGKPRVRRHIDPPTHDVLALMVSWGEPQYLDHARGGRIVSIISAVGDAQAHIISGISNQGSVIRRKQDSGYNVRTHQSF